jgi:hypothetical protein
MMIWVHSEVSIEDIKINLEYMQRILASQYRLMFARKQIKYQTLLSNYKICRYSTLFFVLHMDGREMVKGAYSSSKPCFKDVVKNKISNFIYSNSSYVQCIYSREIKRGVVSENIKFEYHKNKFNN